MYELIKSCLLLTGLLMIVTALCLLLPEYVDIPSLKEALAIAIG